MDSTCANHCCQLAAQECPSGQPSVTRGASIQTTVVRTTRAPLGAPACVTLGRVQARDCRNIEPNQAHISNTPQQHTAHYECRNHSSFSTENATEQGIVNSKL